MKRARSGWRFQARPPSWALQLERESLLGAVGEADGHGCQRGVRHSGNLSVAGAVPDRRLRARLAVEHAERADPVRRESEEDGTAVVGGSDSPVDHAIAGVEALETSGRVGEQPAADPAAIGPER